MRIRMRDAHFLDDRFLPFPPLLCHETFTFTFSRLPPRFLPKHSHCSTLGSNGSRTENLSREEKRTRTKSFSVSLLLLLLLLLLFPPFSLPNCLSSSQMRLGWDELVRRRGREWMNCLILLVISFHDLTGSSIIEWNEEQKRCNFCSIPSFLWSERGEERKRRERSCWQRVPFLATKGKDWKEHKSDYSYCVPGGIITGLASLSLSFSFHDLFSYPFKSAERIREEERERSEKKEEKEIKSKRVLRLLSLPFRAFSKSEKNCFPLCEKGEESLRKSGSLFETITFIMIQWWKKEKEWGERERRLTEEREENPSPFSPSRSVLFGSAIAHSLVLMPLLTFVLQPHSPETNLICMAGREERERGNLQKRREGKFEEHESHEKM